MWSEANGDCCGRRHHHPHEQPACDSGIVKVEAWRTRVPSLRAAWVPSRAVWASPVLQWHFPWTARGDNALEPCRHHVPTNSGAACGGYSSHTAACSHAGRWLQGRGCAGARERHGRATGRVLCMPGTEALLPGFCLERACAKPADHWEPVCASADVSVTEAVHVRDNMWKAAS